MLSSKAKRSIGSSKIDKKKNRFTVSWEEEYPLEKVGDLQELRTYLKSQLNDTINQIKRLKQQGEKIREQIETIDGMEKER